MPTATKTAAVLSERGIALRRAFEVPVLVAALAVVPVVLIEEQATHSALHTVAVVVNWLIWGAFLAEHVVVGRHATSRRAYAKADWLNVVVIVVTFPLLPHVLDFMRLARLTRLAPALRVLRLMRLAVLITRGGLAARALLGKRHLAFVTVLTLLICIAFGAGFALLEHNGSILDGIWWAIETITTVGFGDVYPTTGPGRIVGSLLMVLGIAYVAYLTAVVAAHFVERDLEEELAADTDHLDRIEQRLTRIEALLSERNAPPPEPAPVRPAQPDSVGRAVL